MHEEVESVFSPDTISVVLMPVSGEYLLTYGRIFIKLEGIHQWDKV